MRVDLNCDMGEGYGRWSLGDDAAMLDVVTSANIACGFHAGDPNIMVETARLAREKGVAIGAHPGFNDLWGFGRRVIRGDSMAEIERMVAYQIGAMQALAALAGHKVTYVKAHGSLNNMANEDEDLAGADEDLALVEERAMAKARSSSSAAKLPSAPWALTCVALCPASAASAWKAPI